GRKRRIFGHTGRTWPNCTDRTIGRAARPVVPPALGGQRGSGVTKDPSLPPLGPTLAQDFFTASQDKTRCAFSHNTARSTVSPRPSARNSSTLLRGDTTPGAGQSVPHSTLSAICGRRGT